MNTATLLKAHVLVEETSKLKGDRDCYMDACITQLIDAEQALRKKIDKGGYNADQYLEQLQAILVRKVASGSVWIQPVISPESLPDDDLAALTMIAKSYGCPLAVQLFHNLQADYSALKR